MIINTNADRDLAIIKEQLAQVVELLEKMQPKPEPVQKTRKVKL